MNKIVILDTNFLVSNTGKIKEIVSLIEAKGNLVYIPQMVQEEYINIQLRKVKEQYKKIEVIKNNNPYFDIKFRNEEQVLDANEIKFEKLFKDTFGEKIINCNDEDMLKNVLLRNRYKYPPFFDEIGSSDKGFKDTIIWLALKKFINEYKGEAKFYYVTSDNGFTKYKQKLEREIIDNKLEIIDTREESCLMKALEIENKCKEEKEEENIFQKTENSINIDEIRDKINELMWHFNFFIDEDWAGNTYEVKRYEIYEYMTRETTEQFLKNIPMIIEQNIFSKEIMVGNFFEKGSDVYQKGVGIKLEVMNEMYSTYKLVMKTEYEEPFINFVMKKINENVVRRSSYGNSEEDDLPF